MSAASFADTSFTYLRFPPHLAANELIDERSSPSPQHHELVALAASAAVPMLGPVLAEYTPDEKAPDLSAYTIASPYLSSYVASLSALWASKGHVKHPISLKLPAVLDLTCSLPTPFYEVLSTLLHAVGPLSVAKVTANLKSRKCLLFLSSSLLINSLFARLFR